jgi:polyhydroxyalkanoate synthesis regulator phasin
MVDEWPMSLEEAKMVREDLMDQRKVVMDTVNDDYEEAVGWMTSNSEFEGRRLRRGAAFSDEWHHMASLGWTH